jgi:hypothetical protein
LSLLAFYSRLEPIQLKRSRRDGIFHSFRVFTAIVDEQLRAREKVV